MNCGELIRLVERKTASVINLDCRHPAFSTDKRFKMPPDQLHHHGEYCRYVKSGGGFCTCVGNKARSLEIAKRGRSFHGICPYGVWDLALPVMFRGALAAVVYLGYYRIAGQGAGAHDDNLWRGKVPPEITAAKIVELREWGRFIVRFLHVELELWSETGIVTGKHHDEGFYADACGKFIDMNYHDNIALSDLAELLCVNPDYLGHALKRVHGKTFRGMLAAKRIAEAKSLLENQTRTITEVAMACGFSDSNYFSAVFRRLTGRTPSGFRRGE